MIELIKRIVNKPMTYAEISKRVGKTQLYDLAICLTKMVRLKMMYYKEPTKFTAEAPVYSNKPIPKRFKFPHRDGTPVAKDEDEDNDQLPSR